MKTMLLILIIFILGGIAGALLINHYPALHLMDQQSSTAVESTEKKPLYWVAPMDKNYRRDGPGLSPMGMELIPVYADDAESAEGEVRISPVVENNLGVKTAEVKRGDLIRPIETIGTVQFDESRITHLHSRVEGWIEVLNISSVGDRVKRGQTLYELYSPALVNAQEEYLAALRSGNSNLINASKSRLVALGLDHAHLQRLDQQRRVDQRVKVLAEVDGVVKAMMVRQGMFIKPATEIASIAPLDSVWVVADVLERQSGLVELQQVVDVTFNALPGQTRKGKVSYIYPELNPFSRTLQVRVKLDNPGDSLKPNMLARLSIQAGRINNSVIIPRAALIKAGTHQRVVKALGEGKFRSVLVEAGVEGHDAETNEAVVQIVKGIAAGDRVVSSAQFLIDSESNIDAELLRMQQHEMHNHDAPKNNEPKNIVWTKGIINSVMPGHAMLNITHDAIPEWDWPEMRMNFDVAAGIDIQPLNQGETIRFSIQKQAGGNFSIIDIQALETKKEEVHHHDH